MEAALAQLRVELNVRKSILDDAMNFARFNSDMMEIESWIDDKQKRISAESDRQAKLTSIEDKMKRLQKHQVLFNFHSLSYSTVFRINSDCVNINS